MTEASLSVPENPYRQDIEIGLGHQPPDSLFLLSGGIAYPILPGGRSSARLSETTFDPERFPENPFGGKDHSVAALELAKFYPEAIIVTNSHDEPEWPSNAAVATEYLKRRGLDNQIIVQEKSRGTSGELHQLLNLAREKKWKRVVVVTSAFHVPRALAMLVNYQELGPAIKSKIGEHYQESDFDRNNELLLKTSINYAPNTAIHNQEYQQLMKKIDDLLKGHNKETNNHRGGDLSIIILPSELVLAARNPHYQHRTNAITNTKLSTTLLKSELTGAQAALEGVYGQ